MASQRARYQAYMLRLWQDEAGTDWRASLENPHTGERRGFASLEALFTFLKQRAGQSDQDAQPSWEPVLNTPGRWKVEDPAGNGEEV